MAADEHQCGEECVCPVHGTPLIYWPHGDDHACQDGDCRYGHGMARDDLTVLAQIGRMYLDAVDADPDMEYLTLADALTYTSVLEAVERQEARNASGQGDMRDEPHFWIEP